MIMQPRHEQRKTENAVYVCEYTYPYNVFAYGDIVDQWQVDQAFYMSSIEHLQLQNSRIPQPAYVSTVLLGFQ